MGEIFIEIDELQRRLVSPAAPIIFDVRRREAFESAERLLPTARWRDHRRVADWAEEIPAGEPVVVYCVHGEQVSQSAAAVLRAGGIPAQALRHGIEGWCQAGAPTILKKAWPGRQESRPSRWVTRSKPKIDRIACPWFLRRFVDRDAEVLFVEPRQVEAAAEELEAVPFDVPNVAFSHDGERCSFDAFLERFGVQDPALEAIAEIVRGADTGRLDLAPEAAGLLALSLGISALARDDHDALERGLPLYDALYAWRRHAAEEVHGWPPAAVAT